MGEQKLSGIVVVSAQKLSGWCEYSLNGHTDFVVSIDFLDTD